MPRINQLNLSNFRCFEQFSLSFDKNMTFITGDNGVGKTSIIEAIYFLGKGKSFRSNKTDLLIQNSQKDFTINASILDDENNKSIIGINKQKSQDLICRVNKENVRLSTLSKQIPVIEINPQITDFFAESPSLRRKSLFYYMFHVEQSFYHIWKRASKALNQRNAVLKTIDKANAELEFWTTELIESNQQLIAIIEQEFEILKSFMPDIVNSLLKNSIINAEELSLLLYNGMSSKDETYEAILKQQEFTDIKQGFTQSGFHRIDYSIKYQNKAIETLLSRGQLKLVSTALKLAFNRGISNIGSKPVILIDEIAAELDSSARQALFTSINEMGNQAIITSVDVLDDINTLQNTLDYTLFHMEH